MTDKLDRFLFEDRPIRGEIITVEDSFEAILKTSNYPKPVKVLLGELMASSCLLAATLKFKGEISLQVQSEGLVKYAVVNGTHDLKVKGVARWDEALDSLNPNFPELFEKGVLAITITPDKGQRYQGMVSLDKDSLAKCVEDYFLQSEQLLTKIFLATHFAGKAKAGGMLLQIVPTTSETSNVEESEDFVHVSHLANTISDVEFFSISHEQMITRLYHEDDILIFEATKVAFYCDCSRKRCAGALMNIAKQELLQMIEEDGQITIDCQFCLAKYLFDKIDIENLHSQNLSSGRA